MSFDKPAVEYAQGYAIILKQVQGDSNVSTRREEFSSLNAASDRFEYHRQYLRWSLAHKNRMGVTAQTQGVQLILWDKREGFELKAEEIWYSNPS